jgi:hypothetical protein
MSKRKKKFRNQQFHQSSAPAPASSGVAASPVAQVQPQSPVAKPSTPATVQSDPNAAAYAAHQREYINVHKDLIRVLVVNGLLFAVVLTVYFINQQNGFLDAWFNQIF